MAVVVPTAFVAIATGAGPHAVDTLASFTDAAVAATPTGFASHTVAPPASVTCSPSGGRVTYSWPHRDTRYAYRVTLEDAEGLTVKTYPVVTLSLGLAAGGSVSQQVVFDDVGSTVALGTPFTIRIRSLTRTGTWESHRTPRLTRAALRSSSSPARSAAEG